MTRLLLLPLAIAASLSAQSPILNEDISVVYFEPVSYPLNARLQRVQGTVVAKAGFDTDGNVTAVSAISGAKALIADSLSALKKWKFKPNTQRTAVIVIQFRIEGLCQLPCTSQFRFEPPNFAVVTIGTPVADHAAQ